MKLSERFPGRTVYVCFGKYAGFRIDPFYDGVWRIVFGWVSISACNFDIEQTMDGLLDAVDQLKKQND